MTFFPNYDILADKDIKEIRCIMSDESCKFSYCELKDLDNLYCQYNKKKCEETEKTCWFYKSAVDIDENKKDMEEDEKK